MHWRALAKQHARLPISSEPRAADAAPKVATESVHARLSSFARGLAGGEAPQELEGADERALLMTEALREERGCVVVRIAPP